MELTTGTTFDLKMNISQTAGVWEIVQFCPEMPNQRVVPYAYAARIVFKTKGHFQC